MDHPLGEIGRWKNMRYPVQISRDSTKFGGTSTKIWGARSIFHYRFYFWIRVNQSFYYYHSRAKKRFPMSSLAKSEPMSWPVVSRGWNHGKHVVQVGVRVRGLRGSGGLKNTRNTQKRHNGLFWFGPIRSLRPAADDPYTQEYQKSRGLCWYKLNTHRENMYIRKCTDIIPL
jgi:hypothetical protein